MDNKYFTYWMARYGKEEFTKLIQTVSHNTTVPLEIREKYDTDTFLFHYFYVVYYVVALKHFGLDLKQISFLMELSLTSGVCKLFPPDEILKIQENVIPEIINYIKKDLELFGN